MSNPKECDTLAKVVMNYRNKIMYLEKTKPEIEKQIEVATGKKKENLILKLQDIEDNIKRKRELMASAEAEMKRQECPLP